MQLVIAAVGHKMPAWIDTGFTEYANYSAIPRIIARFTKAHPEERLDHLLDPAGHGAGGFGHDLHQSHRTGGRNCAHVARALSAHHGDDPCRRDAEALRGFRNVGVVRMRGNHMTGHRSLG